MQTQTIFAHSFQKQWSFTHLFELCQIIWILWKLIWNPSITIFSISSFQVIIFHFPFCEVNLNFCEMKVYKKKKISNPDFKLSLL